MTEAPESKLAHGVPAVESAQHRPQQDRPNRLTQAMMWVGIVAGAVFVIAVIFFSGFFLGWSFNGPSGTQGGTSRMGPGGHMGPGGMQGGMMGPGGTSGGMMGPGGMHGGMMGPGGMQGGMMGPDGPMGPASQSPTSAAPTPRPHH